MRETKDVIIALRKNLNLSQDEMAEKLFVTRQAVSRWENGETVPGTETLKLISREFGISADILLGTPPQLCQSCGMVLDSEEVKGSEPGGSKSEEYCVYCYREGAFTQDLTMEEAIDHNLEYLDDWNKGSGLNLTKEEARSQLRAFLPTLKRWRAQ